MGWSVCVRCWGENGGVSGFVFVAGYVKPAAGGYFTHTRALKRRDPLDKFQHTTSDVEMQDLTSPV